MLQFNPDSESRSKALLEKWDEVLTDENAPKLDSYEKRVSMAQILENTVDEHSKSDGGSQFFTEASSVASAAVSAGSANYDPVLISLVRRAAPNLIAYDLCGVQPMTGPTGLIFALRPRYDNQAGADAWFNEVNTGQSTITGGNTQIMGDANATFGGIYGVNTSTIVSGNSQQYNFAGAMSTAQAEALGTTGNADFKQMSVTIDSINVQAKSRALKSTYSTELAQDMKAIHGLDAETELANILSGELLAEINREVIRTIVLAGIQGCPNTTTAGVFNLDIDSNGRWLEEKFKGMLFQIELECNAIAKQTRRGKGNIMLCSSNVASALSIAGRLNSGSALSVDDTGSTFAGTLPSGVKVYIDPYAAGDYWVVGYKGDKYNAGIYYCPYVPMQLARAIGQDSFQPAIAYKTRYAMAANPFSQGLGIAPSTIAMNVNKFYSRSLITNIV